MKKVIALISSIPVYFSNVVQAAAVDQTINIKQPNVGIRFDTPIGTVIGNVIQIIFSIAMLLVLFFLIWGAFEWITSGGDKEGVGKARGKIINALIGLAILALAFLIARVVGNIVNVDLFNLTIPALGPRP